MTEKIKSSIISVFLPCLLASVFLLNACSPFAQNDRGSVAVSLPAVSSEVLARYAADDVVSYTVRISDSSDNEVKSLSGIKGGGNCTITDLLPGNYTVSVEAYKNPDEPLSLVGAGETGVLIVEGETAKAEVVLRYYGAAVLSVYYNNKPYNGVCDISILKTDDTEPVVPEKAELSDGLYTLRRLTAKPSGIEYTFKIDAKYSADGIPIELSGSEVSVVVSGETQNVRIDLTDNNSGSNGVIPDYEDLAFTLVGSDGTELEKVNGVYQTKKPGKISFTVSKNGSNETITVKNSVIELYRSNELANLAVGNEENPIPEIEISENYAGAYTVVVTARIDGVAYDREFEIYVGNVSGGGETGNGETGNDETGGNGTGVQMKGLWIGTDNKGFYIKAGGNVYAAEKSGQNYYYYVDKDLTEDYATAVQEGLIIISEENEMTLIFATGSNEYTSTYTKVDATPIPMNQT